MTPLQWADTIADSIAGRYRDLGLDPTVTIGNPNVGGDIDDCGLRVHVEVGEAGFWSPGETWPMLRADFERNPKPQPFDAAELFVRILDCVTHRGDDGSAPHEPERRENVEHVWALGWELHRHLQAERTVWRARAGFGWTVVGPVEPEPKQGRFGGWTVRLVVPVC